MLRFSNRPFLATTLSFLSSRAQPRDLRCAIRVPRSYRPPTSTNHHRIIVGTPTSPFVIPGSNPLTLQDDLNPGFLLGPLIALLGLCRYRSARYLYRMCQLGPCAIRAGAGLARGSAVKRAGLFRKPSQLGGISRAEQAIQTVRA
jgi:hypothetical protein